VACAAGGLALVLRLLFATATPDLSWPGSVWFAGDAATFVDNARVLAAGGAPDLGLPLRPPGTTALVRGLLTLGLESVVSIKLFWVALGAFGVAVATWAAQRSLGAARGAWAGLLLAGSSGLMMVSTSISAEAPYLLVVLGLVALWVEQERRSEPLSRWVAVSAGVLHGLALLIRADHLVFLVLHVGWMGWRRRGWVWTALVAALMVIAPWHIAAWSRVAQFNRVAAQSPGPAVREVERLLSAFPWTPQAAAKLEQLPAFARRESRAFVAATVAWRGGQMVDVGDLEVLDQAFGGPPVALPERFLVALYGPLNLALANRPGGPGGWDRSLLEQPPPLVGGTDRYPPVLVLGLPPPELTLAYPPHTHLIRDGAARAGEAWVAAPLPMLALVGRKAVGFWSGTSLGVSGWNLPLGERGVRLPVDILVPELSWGVGLWRVAILVLLLWGIGRAWRQPAMWPWLALLVGRLVPALAVFGYARFGATAVPAVVVLILALTGRSSTVRGWPVVAAGVLLLALETGRWFDPPQLVLDGVPISANAEEPRVAARSRHLDVAPGGK
jgi:hypothetical protein